MVTQRLRLSWTLWRRRRTQRRLDRALHRLDLLQQMGAQEVLLVNRLQRELHPLQPVQVEAPREPAPPPLPDPQPSPLLETEPEPETQEPEPEWLVPLEPEEPEEPEPEMEPAPQQIAQLLGLPTQRTTSLPWRR